MANETKQEYTVWVYPGEHDKGVPYTMTAKQLTIEWINAHVGEDDTGHVDWVQFEEVPFSFVPDQHADRVFYRSSVNYRDSEWPWFNQPVLREYGVHTCGPVVVIPDAVRRDPDWEVQRLLDQRGGLECGSCHRWTQIELHNRRRKCQCDGGARRKATAKKVLDALLER
jgi:hypothetical protein